MIQWFNETVMPWVTQMPPSPIPHNTEPVIAMVGRPNVGKSTLFNRLIGARKAVVSSSRGTTRDRIYGQARWRGAGVTLVDTGGFEFRAGDGLSLAVQLQVQRALEQADAFVLVCDAQDGLVPADAMILEHLRTAGKPVTVAVNKLDHELLLPPEFHALGVDALFPVSALHGLGTGDFLDHLVSQFAPAHADRSPDEPALGGSVAVSIIGRQNVGKSSLLNALLREERVIVHERPGTTRDAVDTRLRVGDRSILLIDTAGLRHRRKVKDPVDLFSMSRTLEALGRCEIALVVLDATQGVTRDDRRIVAKVGEMGRGLILLANKWDLVRGGSERPSASLGTLVPSLPRDERKLADALRHALPSASFAPILAVSAKTGFQVPRCVTLLLEVVRAMRQTIPQAECLALLRRAWSAHPPPRFQGRVIRLQQARWLPGLPALLELTTAPLGRLQSPYQRRLLNYLHAQPRLSGVPIKLVVKGPKR